MNDGELLSLLNRVNPWWRGNEVQLSLRKAEHRRRDFYKIREALETSRRQILTIRGPRQVGKTTLCGQLIESLLIEEGVEQERILYLTIENSRILADPAGTIEQAIEVYRDNILRESFRDVGETVYVFIDEVQKSPDWADTLKYYTDTFSNLRFVVTGSISTLIKTDAGETLVGRMAERILLPMKFIEYVRHEGVMEEEEIYDESTGLRASLEEAVLENDRGAFVSELTRFFGVNQEIKPKIDAEKEEYLLKGGYPGVLTENVDEAYGLLDIDLRNTVTGDLCSVFNVEKPQTILRVLTLLAESTGSKINKSNMADVCGVSRQTIDTYLEHLDEFFLISRCQQFRTSEYRRNAQPKIYLQDVGLLNTLTGAMSRSTLEHPTMMGPVLETAVCDHARRLQFYLSGAHNADVDYWDAKGEVDFVLSGQDYLLPIEVKHGDSTSRDLNGLRTFVEENELDFGICVNNAGELNQDEDVVHVPAWIFLFLC